MSNRAQAYMMAMIAAAMAAGDTSFLSSTTKVPDEGRVIRPIIPPIPKGCSIYYLDSNGKCLLPDDATCVFECVALSYKNAMRKFKNR